MSAFSPALAASLLLLAAALAYAHAVALVGMKAMWDGTPMYSFGYIVPFVSAYLVWTRREALAAVVPAPAWIPGFAALAVAIGLLVGGHLGGVLIAQQLAVVVSLVAVVLLVWGRQALRLVWMALAYLLLVVPFWDAFTEPLHLPFQQLSANLGVQMLHLVGVPAHRDGVFLYLPNITLEVARACSGVNYLIAILALGVPLAYLYLPTNGRRLLLVTSAVAVAALSNSLRVAMIGVLAYYDVGSPLHGPAHVLHGLFVSGIGYVVLFAGLRLLNPGHAPATAAAAAPRPDLSLALRSIRPALVRSLVLAATFAAIGAGPMRHEPSPIVAQPLARLPLQVGEWTAQPWEDETPSPWWTNADDELRRTYHSRSGTTVQVAVAYFGRQTQGREVTSHRLERLHRAAFAAVDLGDGGRLTANAVRLPDAKGRRVGFFWYDIAGRTFASPYRAKAQTLWNTVARQRSDGAIVVLLADAQPEGAPDQERLDEIEDLASGLDAALGGILTRE